MKKIIGGGILLISGIVVYITLLVPASKLALELGSWTTPPGRLGTAIEMLGGVLPMKYSQLLIVIGVILVLWGSIEDEIKNVFSKLKKN